MTYQLLGRYNQGYSRGFSKISLDTKSLYPKMPSNPSNVSEMVVATPMN